MILFLSKLYFTACHKSSWKISAKLNVKFHLDEQFHEQFVWDLISFPEIHTNSSCIGVSLKNLRYKIKMQNMSFTYSEQLFLITVERIKFSSDLVIFENLFNSELFYSNRVSY